MSKAGSTRSSVAGSVRANSPDANTEAGAPEPQQSNDDVLFSAQTSAAETPAELQEESIMETKPSAVAESQSMTESASASSQVPTKDATIIDTAPVIAYGTRSSRNRAGAARPNYAEDKEMDAEFELNALKDNGGRKGKGAAQQTDGETSRQANLSKVIEDDVAQSLAQQNTSKGPIPGTSTFSAKPASTTTATSKKRKVKDTTSQTQSKAQPLQQRPARASVVNLSAVRDSNMLSFETCGARLNSQKQLVADDGTVLQVSGKSYSSSRRVLLINFRSRISRL